MKYIKTKDGRIAEVKENMVVKVCDDAIRLVYKKEPYICVLNGDDDITAQANTIEELCDYYIAFDNDGYCSITQEYDYFIEIYVDLIRHYRLSGAYGAIRRDEGLIYVAKKNEKLEWELL